MINMENNQMYTFFRRADSVKLYIGMYAYASIFFFEGVTSILRSS